MGSLLLTVKMLTRGLGSCESLDLLRSSSYRYNHVHVSRNRIKRVERGETRFSNFMYLGRKNSCSEIGD